MAIAKYFTKDALAIKQLLNIHSVDNLESILNKHVVEIAFDSSASTMECKFALDMIIRLVSRLYPILKISDLSGSNIQLVCELEQIAKSINQNIEFSKGGSTIKLIFGNSEVKKIGDEKIFYCGSKGWSAKFSANYPLGFTDSNIPFAAGFSACIGASNLFRFVFRDFIPDVKYDEEIDLSLLTFNRSQNDPERIETTDLGKVTLVGIGAIGNGAIWSLSKLTDFAGDITLIDKENLSLSNLQRYVMPSELDELKPKVEIAKDSLTNTNFKVNAYHDSWQSFMKKARSWNQEFVLTALDSGKDRIAVQSALVKNILNAFTDHGLLGVSRHFDFLNTACLSCIYLPTSRKKSKSEEVAENLGIPKHEQLIRNQLYQNSLVDENLLKIIAVANKIEYEKIKHFNGSPLTEFYASFVCGGILLSLVQENTLQSQIVDAPLAFQSAMAGILLVSEWLILKLSLRKDSLPNITHIYPLQPIQSGINPYNHNIEKDSTKKCLCSDEDFKLVHKQKWGDLSMSVI